MMIETNTDAISLDQIMNMEEVIKHFPSDKILVGNLDPIRLIGKGTPEEVNKKTTELLDKMEPYDNFMMAFGCNAPNDAPDENIKEAIRVTKSRFRDYGN